MKHRASLVFVSASCAAPWLCLLSACGPSGLPSQARPPAGEDTVTVVEGFGEAPAGWTLLGVAAVQDGKVVLNGEEAHVRGGIRYDGAFASDRDLTLRFDFEAVEKGGADGITLQLVDGSVRPPMLGADGGALAYAYNAGGDGVYRAWLGVGFDAFGNFLNSNVRGTGLGPQAYPDHVSVRGAGTAEGSNAEEQEYDYLEGSAVDVSAFGGIDGGWRTVELTLSGGTTLSLRMSWDQGQTWQTLYEGIDVASANADAGYRRPPTLTFAFAGSTGDGANPHAIDNVEAEYVSGPDLTPTPSATAEPPTVTPPSPTPVAVTPTPDPTAAPTPLPSQSPAPTSTEPPPATPTLAPTPEPTAPGPSATPATPTTSPESPTAAPATAAPAGTTSEATPTEPGSDGGGCGCETGSGGEGAAAGLSALMALALLRRRPRRRA